MTAQSQPENVRLGEDGESVVLLDQTRLPGRVEYRTVRDLKEMVEAIRTLRVRGAPAIGVFAGFCLSALARQMERAGLDTPGLLRELDRKGKILVSSRPTAVNLSWAVERMMDRASGLAGGAPEELAAALEAESRAIRREDEEMCRAIAEHGLSLLKAGDGVLTHCNAGPLATSRYGTALGPILLAGERGIPLRVFADETRPLLQGARLTAWELHQAGVDVTLICDNMASMVMKNGWVLLCRLRPGGGQRRRRQQDRHQRSGHPGQTLRDPLLCAGAHLHHRPELSRRGPHPHRAAGSGGDPLPVVPGAHGPRRGEVLQSGL